MGWPVVSRSDASKPIEARLSTIQRAARRVSSRCAGSAPMLGIRSSSFQRSIGGAVAVGRDGPGRDRASASSRTSASLVRRAHRRARSANTIAAIKTSAACPGAEPARAAGGRRATAAPDRPAGRPSRRSRRQRLSGSETWSGRRLGHAWSSPLPSTSMSADDTPTLVQQRGDRPGALQRQMQVVGGRALGIGMAGDPDVVRTQRLDPVRRLQGPALAARASARRCRG